ncbi:MAG: Rne/Rng family ribonuclease [Burkholderiales bacterium]
MKRMLFNATQAEELRVAIVDGQKLVDLDIESASKEQRKSNIYKGVVTRIEPSLEAAFVDYGSERHGFLPFKEVVRTYFKPGTDVGHARIQDALSEGQELIVQVEKDERGNKGAALTTFVSLAGRYLVLMPNNPRGGGVSRRVEGEERNELRDLMAALDVPQGMSVIARTAGIGRNLEELSWDLNYLLQLWTAIESAAQQQSGAFLIYQESSLVIRAIRDYFHQDIGEILIDTEHICEQARQFMGHVMPGNVNCIKLYKDTVPLFSRFQIEHQIETAYSRDVNLPSGGAVVIDHTEALVSVDVNSARATRGTDIEQTALNTNVEAADEIARQLRLRDLGGLIVIDFIDMESQRNQREVETRLRDALRHDRARVQMGKISRFGLMELSRQRLRPSLGETSHSPCPRCHGTGHIRGVESTALHILRILQEEAMKDNTAAVHAQVPVDVATFLLNEKRADLQLIEARHKVSAVLIPNTRLETPNYTIARLRHDDLNQSEQLAASYNLVDVPAEEETLHTLTPEASTPRQEAAVKGITPAQPAPLRALAPEAGERAASIIDKIFGWFRRPMADEAQPQPAVRTPASRRQHPERRHERPESGERRGQRQNRGRRSDRQRHADDGDKNGRGAAAEPRTPRREEPARPDTDSTAQRPEAERGRHRANGAERIQQNQDHGTHEEGEGSRRRRRRRRGGERHERPDQAADVRQDEAAEVKTTPDTRQREPQSVHQAEHAAADDSAATRPETPSSPTSSEGQPSPQPETVSTVSTEHEAATVVVASAAIAPITAGSATPPQPAEELQPVVSQATPVPAAQPEPAPLAPPVLSPGLEQIETNPGKQHSTTETEPEPAPVRARRQRRVTAPASNEPLVQIETHKHEETAG